MEAINHDLEATDGELSSDEMEIIYATAVSRARLRLALYIHTVAYVLVILLLIVINLLTSPGTIWVVWPFFGWGTALAVHWLTVLKLVPVYESMKEKEIARQLEMRMGQ